MNKLKAIVTVSMLMLTVACSHSDDSSTLEKSASTPDKTKPNIIYILADDMGSGDVSAINPESKISTVHLDRLAAEGVIFNDAHSSSSVCTPTRYALMTGRYSWRSTLKGKVTGGFDPSLIPEERDTVASLLKRNGYKTAMVGKWHLGLDWQSKNGQPVAGQKDGTSNIDYSKAITLGPLELGFDYWHGVSASWNMPPHAFIENRHVTKIPTILRTGNELDYEFLPAELLKAHADGLKGKAMKKVTNNLPMFGWDKGMVAEGVTVVDATKVITEKSVEYINKQDKDKPFFLYVPLTSPHSPVTPNKEFIGKSDAGLYGDFVLETDWTVGEIVKALKAKGLYENTLIIFTADNGTASRGFPKALVKKYQHNTHNGYRGVKGRVYEGGHRVPFIASWPNGDLNKGSESSAVIDLADLYATLADLVDEKVADNTAEDSISMLPFLKDSKKTTTERLLVHQDYHGRLAVRVGDWKLVNLHTQGEKTTKEWAYGLFNLKDDIAEKNNLINQHPEKVKELTKALVKAIRDGRTTQGAKQSNEGPETWKQIEWIKAAS